MPTEFTGRKTWVGVNCNLFGFKEHQPAAMVCHTLFHDFRGGHYSLAKHHYTQLINAYGLLETPSSNICDSFVSSPFARELVDPNHKYYVSTSL